MKAQGLIGSALAATLSLSGCSAQSLPAEPGRALAVVDRGELVVEHYEGLADLEAGAPLTCHTPMRIASLTKAVTAVAILQLVESESLALDDHVSHHLPDFETHRPELTVRQLLHHTGGLPHHSLAFMNSGQVVYDEVANDFLFAPEGSRTDDYMPTNEDAAALLAQSPERRFEPGDAWEYSNAGYIILAQLIEAVSGHHYAAYLEQAIFTPLGMDQAGVFDERRPQPPGAAHSYRVLPDGFEERDYSPFNLLHGDGGVYASLCDLIAWRRAFTPGVLLSAEALATLQEPARLSDGARVTDTPRGSGYGMGWFLDQIEGETVLLHGGGWAQFRHAIYYAPERDLWVVLLTNRSDSQPYEEAEAEMRARWSPPR